MSATGFACNWYLQTLSGDILTSGKSVHQDIDLMFACLGCLLCPFS